MKGNYCNSICNTIVLNKHRSHENRFTLKINFKRHSKDTKASVICGRSGYYSFYDSIER